MKENRYLGISTVLQFSRTMWQRNELYHRQLTRNNCKKRNLMKLYSLPNRKSRKRKIEIEENYEYNKLFFKQKIEDLFK